jgi:hypothetical protein
MKALYLSLVFLIITFNIFLVGCTVTNHDKDFTQEFRCDHGKPVIIQKHSTSSDVVSMDPH